ncbi:hypothetical protein B0H14DRAFT_517125 [Mycena olivaceomarginata]|nr:hypothetical protein B0H14DRAFT_517125 [Mycena olivaceomarginata]
MSDTTGPCICKKTVVNRCSACKLVSYCSKECQRLDWKNHKTQCKAATATSSSKLQVGSASEINELLRVGAQYTIYQESTSQGLNPDLICGTRCVFSPSLDCAQLSRIGFQWSGVLRGRK